jgi:exosortase
VFLAVVAGLWLGAWEVTNQWTYADYSHGFLVPFVCGYLLWLRRDRFPTRTVAVVTAEPTGVAAVAVARTVKVKGPVRWPNRWGLAFFAAAGLLTLFALKTNYAKEPLCGVALGVAFAGVAWMFCGGWVGVKWAWPALAFWVFAVPMPWQVQQKVGTALRVVATEAASASFQLLGFPSYVGAGGDASQRYMITLDGTQLDVAAPCAGLSMLLTFVALTAAICLLCPPSRPTAHRLFVFLTAVPIAVVCNILRIVATGLVYHAGWKGFGDAIGHDMAGWLMMPVALGIIWLELWLLDWVWVPVEYATTDEVAKALLVRAREKAAPPPARLADAAGGPEGVPLVPADETPRAPGDLEGTG